MIWLDRHADTIVLLACALFGLIALELHGPYVLFGLLAALLGDGVR